MDTSILKKFAIDARQKLINQIKTKAHFYGITGNAANNLKNVTLTNDSIAINGNPYNRQIKVKWENLNNAVNSKGFEQVIEEVAYTWFNRFIALRFMECNGYIERVLSSSTEGRHEPDIIIHAETLGLPGVDTTKISKLKDESKTEELYKMLIIAKCNQLHGWMPFMFEKIDDSRDYTELLLPEGLLNEGSVVRALVSELPEEDWKNVEIIGWMYQFYVSEKKDEVFAGLAKNIKVTPENIPAATQLFTPKWIVKYMVENSVGRYWLESHDNDELKSKWKYYITPAEQPPDVIKKLDEIKVKDLNPETIKVIDPACGSGHMLVYAFDVLYDIYKSCGYVDRDIPKLIIEKNLHGLDIDIRAVQLASLCLVMKGREKNRRFFNEQIEINISHISKTENITDESIEHFVGKNDKARFNEVKNFIGCFNDADSLGSLVKIPKIDLEYLKNRTHENQQQSNMFAQPVIEILPQVLKQASLLLQKYDVVITNPPYMGGKGMNSKLSDFLKVNYTDTKSDLFAVFMEKCLEFSKPGAFVTMITQPSWLFLSSFESLRFNVIGNTFLCSLLHMGRGIFGIDWGSASFCIRNIGKHPCNYRGTFFRLHQRVFQFIKSEDIEKIFLNALNTNDYRFNFHKYSTTDEINTDEDDLSVKDEELQVKYIADTEFSKIPGSPIAYWVTQEFIQIFNSNETLRDYGINPATGMQTGDNKKYIRYWFEISDSKRGKKYFPLNDGGDVRKWYGNFISYVMWENNGKEIKAHNSSVVRNEQYYFKEGATWNRISSSFFSIRYLPKGFIFDQAGDSLFTEKENDLLLMIGFLNSSIGYAITKILCPTLNTTAGNLELFPYPKNNEKYIESLKIIINKLICIARSDWDFYETSFNFINSPLITVENSQRVIENKLLTTYHPISITLSKAYCMLRLHWNEMTIEMKRLEEENNRIFIEAYCLQDEISSDVSLPKITLTCNPHYRYGGNKNDAELEAMLQSDTIKEFISYAIGCMMGRYSLDKEGLIFAGGEFNKDNYKTYEVDDDGIIPVLGGAWFNDDIVARFINFVKVTFGEKNLTPNLDFIAEALGKTSNESTDQRIRKYFLTEFYRDHLQTYQKRPIYWLFSSGKKRAFNVLIYMHRYTPAMLAKIRVDYLLQLLVKLETEKRTLENMSQSGDLKQKKQNDKRLKEIDEHIVEIRKYDELLRHFADKKIEIDLDDGVAYNYTRFGNPEKGGGDLVYYDTYFKKDDLLKACDWKTKGTVNSESDDE